MIPYSTYYSYYAFVKPINSYSNAKYIPKRSQKIKNKIRNKKREKHRRRYEMDQVQL